MISAVFRAFHNNTDITTYRQLMLPLASYLLRSQLLRGRAAEGEKAKKRLQYRALEVADTEGYIYWLAYSQEAPRDPPT